MPLVQDECVIRNGGYRCGERFSGGIKCTYSISRPHLPIAKTPHFRLGYSRAARRIRIILEFFPGVLEKIMYIQRTLHATHSVRTKNKQKIYNKKKTRLISQEEREVTNGGPRRRHRRKVTGCQKLFASADVHPFCGTRTSWRKSQRKTRQHTYTN